jgi:hypothetical protein
MEKMAISTILLLLGSFLIFSNATENEKIFAEEPIWTSVTIRDSERGENIQYRVYLAT